MSTGRAVAIEVLAKTLRNKMERLDPSDTFDTEWVNLPESDREFYRLCIEELLLTPSILITAIEEI